MAEPDSLYDLAFTTNTGTEVQLSEYSGKPVLIVNTASKCGFTPQYDDLQTLFQTYSPAGLVVLGFPCDQFAHQEPGDDTAIDEFCRTNHGVTFPLSTKVNVNGQDAHPVFVYLKGRASGLFGSKIKWNFTKFLVAPDGHTVKRYAPNTNPARIAPDIETLLQPHH